MKYWHDCYYSTSTQKNSYEEYCTKSSFYTSNKIICHASDWRWVIKGIREEKEVCKIFWEGCGCDMKRKLWNQIAWALLYNFQRVCWFLFWYVCMSKNFLSISCIVCKKEWNVLHKNVQAWMTFHFPCSKRNSSSGIALASSYEK